MKNKKCETEPAHSKRCKGVMLWFLFNFEKATHAQETCEGIWVLGAGQPQ